MKHMKLTAWKKQKISKPKPGFLSQSPHPSLGARERFSGSHKQRPFLYSSAMISQNTIDKQGAQVLRFSGSCLQTMKGWEPLT